MLPRRMSITGLIYSSQWSIRQRLAALRYSLDRKTVQPTETIENILFVLSGLLGDSVMSVGTIAEARELLPKARITVLGKTHNRELLAADSNIDEFYVCDADPFSLTRSSEIAKLKKWLDDKYFDASVILLGDQFAHLLAMAGIPVRVGVKGTILEPCLTHAYEIGSPREWGANERLNSLRVLGFEVKDRLPKLYVDPQASASADQKLGEFGIERSERYMVLHPFGSTSRQWWPTGHVEALISETNKEAGIRIVLIGGPETSETKINGEFVDTRGRLTIRELLAVIARSDKVITTDSGPFHIAGALGKPIVGLFRSRRPEHANAYPRTQVAFGESERCAKQCEWDRCAVDPCRQMGEITAHEVGKRITEQ